MTRALMTNRVYWTHACCSGLIKIAIFLIKIKKIDFFYLNRIFLFKSIFLIFFDFYSTSVPLSDSYLRYSAFKQCDMTSIENLTTFAYYVQQLLVAVAAACYPVAAYCHC